MTKLNINETPHRRYNPLTGEWILVSPHRTKRPWKGKSEQENIQDKLQYDPNCYLCPANIRANGIKNPDYKNTFVFKNDFAALLPDSGQDEFNHKNLLKAQGVEGTSRVICFSPRHDLTLAEMSTEEIKMVISLWINQTRELGQKYKWIQIFENKGAIMGCSNPHPHGQIWTGSELPNEAKKEMKNQGEYFEKNKTQLLIDYAKIEQNEKKRIVAENSEWMVVVPFWATWPYETLLLPKKQVARLSDLTKNQINELSNILKIFLVKYDNLFSISFPYTMGWHQAPFQKENSEYWTLHAHFYPPLLRSATVKKFMVGYEMLAEAQRDITAEQAADTLKQLSEIHYKLNRNRENK